MALLSAPGSPATSARPHAHVGKRVIESLDYDIDASSLFEQQRLAQSVSQRRRIVTAKWAVCCGTGALTGLLAFLIDTGTEFLTWGKYEIAAAAANSSPDSQPNQAASRAVACYVLCSFLLVTVASCLVLYGEPIAGGSGIPEVKTYLQGVRVPRMLRVTTLVCKAAGVLCSVAGGLVCGKEGPMIHAGAIIAGGVSQGSSKTFRVRTMLLKRFRNDHDKRDFVSAGAAAGVAAAFGAPIGGVLFAMEEAATHWSQALTWRTFFCALCSTFSLNFLLTTKKAVTHSSDAIRVGQLTHPGLLTFGSFECQSPDERLYQVEDLIIFAVIGVICGLVGALFNAANRRLTLWRNRTLTSPRSRLAEALLIGCLTALVSFALPFLVPCTPLPSAVPSAPASVPVFSAATPPTLLMRDDEPGSNHSWLSGPQPAGAHHRHLHATNVPKSCRGKDSNSLQESMHQLVCPHGEYSMMVRLLLAGHDESIKTLFHEGEDGQRISPLVCIIFFCFSLAFGLVTYGLTLPSGLFVPCIMMGAAMGRFVGEAFGGLTSPGNYALIGAAGMLGGICRMTISITVIVVESTGNVTYMLPIAITIMLAKIVGDLFTDGIYDLHIGIKGYPLLEDPDQMFPSKDSGSLQAADVMASGVRTVCELEQVGTLIKLLRTTTHHGFPVVKSGGGGGVLGIVLRDHLMTILAKRRFEDRRASSPVMAPHLQGLGGHAGPSSQAPPLTADDFLRPWTETGIDELAARLSASDLVQLVNLRPYINEAALVTLRTTSLRRVSRLFLSMGLRHLLVVESCPKVVGIITRKDLIHGVPNLPQRPTDGANERRGTSLAARLRSLRTRGRASRRADADPLAPLPPARLTRACTAPNALLSEPMLIGAERSQAQCNGNE